MHRTFDFATIDAESDFQMPIGGGISASLPELTAEASED
jgi:hypothetical protein